MTKNAFTLAEVLITLGIVGTIAAITLPSLMTNTTTAQIGPKLAKAVSVFEQAMENVMPQLEVKAVRKGGATYQVPFEVRPERKQTLGLLEILMVML